MTSRIIFDIETTGVAWDSLDAFQQTSLLKYAEDDEERERAKKSLTFSPLTGEVVAIGLLNPNTDRGVVYYRGSPSIGNEAESREAVKIILHAVDDERELLEKFWADTKNYSQLVSFNGRAFDGPFLHIRSAILGIPATKNLVPYRYGIEHFDLLDQLTFLGATRRTHFSLDMICKAFGIESPKSHGITGDDVPKLFQEGRSEDIARYCAGDLRATKQLLEKWESHMGN